MKLLAGTAYDPASRVQKSTASLLAMTALDTTNLRLSFTAPSNGSVYVRMRTVTRGSATSPQIYLGVLDHTNSDVLKARVPPLLVKGGGSAAGTTLNAGIASFTVSGLTPGAAYTFDAAYGVEVVVASSNIEYGGPNDTSANTAAGAFQFEVWDAPSLLASTIYDPGTVANAAISGNVAMTAFDTTNLRLTFTAPSSGMVAARVRCATAGAASTTAILVGVLDGATVRGRVSPIGGLQNNGTFASTDRSVYDGVMLVTGLSGGTSYTWDAAYGSEVGAASMNISYGGPDNTTTNDAFGGLVYEIWRVDDAPFQIGAMA